MRRLLSAIVALIVSSGVVSADNVVLPVKCVGTDSGFAVRSGIFSSYPILGAQNERDHKVCAHGSSQRCTTLKIHKFDVDCDGRRIAFRELAGAMIRARGAVARTSKGRLKFRLVKPSFASLNAVCDIDRFGPDRTGAIKRWNLDASCRAAGFAPRKTVVLPIGFAPLAELGGRVVAKSEAPSGELLPIGSTNAAQGGLHKAGMRSDGKALTQVRRIEVRTAGQAPHGQSRIASDGKFETAQQPSAAMALPGEASANTVAKAASRREFVVEPKPNPAQAPAQVSDEQALGKSPSEIAASASVVVAPAVSRPPKVDAPVAAPPAKSQTVQVAAAGKTAVGGEATSPSSWNTLVEVVSRRTGEPSAQQQVQHSMVATILGLALVTSLVSGIGWFATQQLLVARKSKSDPYQLILKREVTDLAKPDAQMCGELCRTGQTLITEIHSRVEQIKGAAALRRVLMREVRSMEQFLSATIENAPEDHREWRRTRLAPAARRDRSDSPEGHHGWCPALADVETDFRRPAARQAGSL